MQFDYRVEALRSTFAEATQQLCEYGAQGFEVIEVTGNRVILERVLEDDPQPFPLATRSRCGRCILFD